MMTDTADLVTPLETQELAGLIEAISEAMTRMRLMIGRRMLGRLMISRTAPDLDLSHLDVIEAVRRSSAESEATVGAVAELMRVDHSRASRLIADLVQRGVFRRTVSQADARRTVVELTEEGISFKREMNAVKLQVLETIVADWTQEDIERFAALFPRFVDGLDETVRNASQE
ncbi:MarR family winged helix-turn-helix transcriptional regulator [Rhizobium sp. PAMB 3182]